MTLFGVGLICIFFVCCKVCYFLGWVGLYWFYVVHARIARGQCWLVCSLFVMVASALVFESLVERVAFSSGLVSFLGELRFVLVSCFRWNVVRFSVVLCVFRGVDVMSVSLLFMVC